MLFGVLTDSILERCLSVTCGIEGTEAKHFGVSEITSVVVSTANGYSSIYLLRMIYALLSQDQSRISVSGTPGLRKFSYNWNSI